jgi:hypothetical protein
MLQQTSNYCCHGEGKREGADGVEVVREATAWTRWRWRQRGIEAGAEEWRRRLHSVEEAAMAEQMTRFPGAVMAWTQ